MNTLHPQVTISHGEMEAEVDAELAPLLLELWRAGWETSRSGRKHQTGSALYTSDGRVLARGRATWIEFDPPQV